MAYLGYDNLLISVNFNFYHRNKLYHWTNEKQVNIKFRYCKYLPLHFVKVYTKMQDQGSLIKNGFQKAGISDSLKL